MKTVQNDTIIDCTLTFRLAPFAPRIILVSICLHNEPHARQKQLIERNWLLSIRKYPSYDYVSDASLLYQGSECYEGEVC